jgi:hypothetical protein
MPDPAARHAVLEGLAGSGPDQGLSDWFNDRLNSAWTIPEDLPGPDLAAWRCGRSFQYSAKGRAGGIDRPQAIPRLRLREGIRAVKALVAEWFRRAGFALDSGTDPAPEPPGLQANGLQVDGLFRSGPEGIPYPSLWFCQVLGERRFQAARVEGLARSNPLVLGAIYLVQSAWGFTDRPAVLSGVSLAGFSLIHEPVEYDDRAVRRWIDRVNLLDHLARSGEEVPRGDGFSDPLWCLGCPWRVDCEGSAFSTGRPADRVLDSKDHHAAGSSGGWA